MNKAVFLDRDGTVIRDHGYLDNVDQVELVNGAGKALDRLRHSGFLLVLVTNQSGIGRGLFDHDMVVAQHKRLTQLLDPWKVAFSAIQVCPHAPNEQCDCRKPSPKLLLDAADKLDIDLEQSVVIGDKPSDVIAGKNAGCHLNILIADDNKTTPADYVAKNLVDAVDYILRPNSKRESIHETGICTQ